MDWGRAKNYILVFFLLLNIGLGLLLLLENQRYTLSGERIRIIRTVLDQNNISMYTHPMRRFPPMRPIEVTGFYYSEETTDRLLAIFFESPQYVSRTGTGGNYDFMYGGNSLRFSNGFIAYSNLGGFRELVPW